MENLDPKESFCHLSSAIGHKVVNALSTIVSQAEILRTVYGSSGKVRAEIDQAIDSINGAALDSALVIQRMMDCGHEAIMIDPTRPDQGWEEVYLDRLVSEAAVMERERLGPGVSLVTDTAPVPAIRGQPRALRSMLKALIDNATESLARGSGTITVRTFVEPDGRIVVEVRDDGTGISAEALERAADPFFTTKPGHRGIGLTIARSIWRRHRGFALIESEPGRGTVVRFTVSGVARP